MLSSKNALIITGPQGSGNHLFSKIFSLHPEVSGWSELNQRYWIGHDEEPFADLWTDPSKLLERDWSEVRNLVTSISCPYINDGVETIPQYLSFISGLSDVGFNVQIAVIGRDSNILAHQQARVRGRVTKDIFTEAVKKLGMFNPVFISTELLYLYRRDYLISLQRLLNVPIAVEHHLVDEILVQDPNAKYFQKIDQQPLDQLIHEASKPKALRNL